MTTSYTLTDLAGCVLRAGDLVLNDQGRVFVVKPTDPTIAAQRCATVVEVRQRGLHWRASDKAQPTYARVYHCLRVDPLDTNLGNERKANQRYFDRLAAPIVAGRLADEARARKQRTDTHARDLGVRR